jgi:NAD/NADP transhydrogenase beta subunit
MLYIIIAIFAIAAVVGIIILKNWLTSAETSRTVVYTHGIFAAIALVLLLIWVIQHKENGLMLSLVLFVIAALVGFYMFFKDLKGKYSPTWLAVVHGLLAVAGFLVLIFYVI